jgi:large subunit ribosomal protein L21
MYAVIKTGGKQYKVETGQVLDVELLGEAVGSSISFTPLLVVDGANVVSSKAALATAKGPKIVGFMYKSKARAQRRWGHRQKYATVKVTAITA